jgi:ribulose-phosphate 3-epimerase
VSHDNAAALVEAGADVLVAGNFVFGSPDPVATLAELRAQLSENELLTDEQEGSDEA